MWVLPLIPGSWRWVTVTSPPCLLTTTSHCQTYTPAVLRGHGDRFIRNVIAVNNQNRDFGQYHKLLHRNRPTLQRVECAWHRGRGFFLREDKIAARFESDNGFDIVDFYCCVPAWSDTLRVGEENIGKNRGIVSGSTCGCGYGHELSDHTTVCLPSNVSII